VPLEYRALLLEKPINAGIAEVRDFARGDTRYGEWIRWKAVIDAGKAAGVVEGMEFHSDFGTLTVKSVDDSSCIAEVVEFVPKGARVDLPSKGLKVSTTSTTSMTQPTGLSPFR